MIGTNSKALSPSATGMNSRHRWMASTSSSSSSSSSSALTSASPKLGPISPSLKPNPISMSQSIPMRYDHTSAIESLTPNGDRTPSGFGLHSIGGTASYTPKGKSYRPTPYDEMDEKSFKGHPIRRMPHPYILIGLVSLIFLTFIAVVFVPSGSFESLNSLKTTSVVDISTGKNPHPTPVTVDTSATTKATTIQSIPAEPETLVSQTSSSEHVNNQLVTSPTIAAEKATETPTESKSTSMEKSQPESITLQTADSMKIEVSSSPLNSVNDNSQFQADLIDSELYCDSSLSSSSSPPTSCDWHWGPSPSSSNSEDHTREELELKEADYKKPQDFYTYQAGVEVTGEGPGAIVRIKMRDLCCTGADMPISYFRITAHGASQAASLPPLSLGSLPTSMGRGHQGTHLTQTNWGKDIKLENIDEERVLQTFLLLPDPGYYEIRVHLLHYNVSRDMISENYQMNSKLYNQRPGVWVNQHLRNRHGVIGTKLFIHPAASTHSHAYTGLQYGRLPKCGLEGNGQLGGASHTGTRYGMPLAGRWVYKPPNGDDPLKDYTDLDQRHLVEHSQWTPYFCQLDHDISYTAALEKVQWMHFTGDSNTRHMFYYVCELGNGTLLSVNPDRVPRYLDPPHACIGPSSDDNRPDSVTGLQVGSKARWVLTYTNWFWGKKQTLDQRPETDFGFRTQCQKFVEQNKTGLFYGWPQCELAPNFIQEMSGPGLTYFGWGSHAAEFGANPATSEYFQTEEAFRLPFFYDHPVIFPLTTANTPSLIPDKFGKQQVMRNNERVHASNVHLVDAVLTEYKKYETRAPGGYTDPKSIIPIFDLFSPTFAAYEVLACDAVHFDKFFSYEEPKYLMHYIYHAANWGPKKNPN